MTSVFSWLSVSTLLLGLSVSSASASPTHLFGPERKSFTIKENDHQALEIFCVGSSPLQFSSFWTSAVMRLKIESEDYDLFLGRNLSSVMEMYKQSQATWFYTALPWRSKDVKLNPFEESCVGVFAKDKYTMSLHQYRVNYWLVMMSLAGALLFYYAPSLCRNVIFHYTTGVGAGILFSLLIVTYFAQKKFRSSYLSWVAIFYSLSVYMLTTLWYNVKVYLVEHQIYVLAYFVLVGGISFSICYRMGPIENPRSLNLIQWALQLFALILIYLSSYHQMASLTVALCFITYNVIPARFKSKASVLYRTHIYKPKVRLLTESEYMDQSRIVTEQELEKLRSFCASPKCNSWSVIPRLSTPQRFAEFVNGSPHVSSDEVIQYSHAIDDDMLLTDVPMTDDDSSDSENFPSASRTAQTPAGNH